MSQKSTPYDAFDEINQVVIDEISYNMASLVQYGKYGTINTTKTATNGFYVIMFTSEAYKLQDSTTIDGKIITAVNLVVKAQFLCSVQEIANCFWYQHPQHQVITLPTGTILHPLLDVTAIIDIHEISKIVCNRTQAKNLYQDIIYV